MSDEQSPFAKGGGGAGGGGQSNSDAYSAGGSESGPIYHDQTAKQVMLERGIFIAAKVNLFITLILCIVRSALRPVNAGLYLMYGLSLCLFVALEVYLIQLARTGELANQRRWFLYLFVIFLFVQCICTDILVFQ